MDALNDFYTDPGTEIMRETEEIVPPTFGQGGHNIFCTLILVIENNVVVHISWLHYCWKRFPSIKTGNK